MFKRIVVFLLIAAVMLAGCSGAKNESLSDFSAENGINGVAPSMPEEAFAPEMERPSTISSDATGQAQAVERLVIRNANLSIVVVDPVAVMEEISRMAEGMGGYVVNSNLYQTRTSSGLEVPEAQITVRVEALMLDEALNQIKGHVKDPVNDVLYENISGQDVTQEYTDLQSRLRNLEDAAEQLRKILDNAVRTEDVLQVFNELKSVNEQIEVLKGQIQYYEQSAKLSAITVTIQAEASVQPINVGGWEPKGIIRDAVQALIDAYQWIANAAIWIVVFCLPIALPIGLVLFFVIRGLMKWNRKRKAKKMMVEDTETAK